jgi:hypothetical protein
MTKETQQLIPDTLPDNTHLIMLKPDFYDKPNICESASKDILLGLGDVLCNHVSQGFYTSPHGEVVTNWALDQWREISIPDESKREPVVMGLESLRVNSSTLTEIPVLTKSILTAAGYTIKQEVECMFSESQIRRLYSFLDKPAINIKEEIVKKEVLDSMLEKNIKFLFLSGPMGYDFLDVIRFFLRKTVRDYTREIVNSNESLIHIPDLDGEHIRTLKLLQDYFNQPINP